MIPLRITEEMGLILNIGWFDKQNTKMEISF